MKKTNARSHKKGSKAERYLMSLVDEYQSIRQEIGHINSDLLRAFSGGQSEILKRLAAGLSKAHPAHPDLSVIHAVIHQMDRAEPAGRTVPSAGRGKGRSVVHSIPLQDVPKAMLRKIEMSSNMPRMRKDLVYALRSILGAARRSGLPETLSTAVLSAYRLELYGRGNSAKTTYKNILHLKRLCEIFAVNRETMTLVQNELRASEVAAAREPSQRNADFRARPLTPLDYARLARSVSEEAYATTGNRQTVQRLFTTAAALAFLSFMPERVSDILNLVIGQQVVRDAKGWSSAFFSSKSKDDRSSLYLPDQLTPYLDDLILLGADPGPAGRDFINLYRYRVELNSPLFARTDLVRSYSAVRVFELVKEKTGHGPHAARKAMNDYIAEIGGSPTDILNLLGHRSISTSEKHYDVRASAIRRRTTVESLVQFRENLDPERELRVPSGQLIDLEGIAKRLNQV